MKKTCPERSRRIYLDHNATTPVDKRVLDAMEPYFCEIYGNPSSIHLSGQEARKVVEDSRRKVMNFIGADLPEEIVFTSCGTESDNFAIKGTVFASREKGNHIITSKIEHHAVLEPCEYLAKYFGFEVTYLDVDGYGIVDPADVEKAITKKTVLISVMYANNETGVIQPIEEIAKTAGKHNIVFHTDAVQMAGKFPIDVKKLGADLLSVSGHKMYAPKGCGFIYIKKGTKMHSLLHGGKHEKGWRAGTENVPYIAGMAKACEIAQKNMADETARLLKLREKLEIGVINGIEHTFLNGHPEKRLANTSNISFKYIEGEGLILLLNKEGIEVSTGSACTSGSIGPSHVLSAMHIDPITAQGSVRFSLGHENTEKDIDRVLKVLPKIVGKLRSMSPLWSKRR